MQLFEGLDQRELVLLMLQTLSAMGFTESQECLEREAGTVLESENVKTLHKAVINAEWEKAFAAVRRLDVEEVVQQALQFILLEQKYLECVAQDVDAALCCLRDELCGAVFDQDSRHRLHEASSYLMCRTPEDLERASGWSYQGSREALWERAMTLLPSHLIVPPSA
jgi:hypothetical protein